MGGGLDLAAMRGRGGEDKFVVVAACERELVHDVFGQGLAQRGQSGHGMGMDFCAHAGGGEDVSEVLGKPVGDILGGGGEGEEGLPKGDARGGAQAGGFALGE